jgi:Zn-dependent protease with chaperone function
VTRRLSGRYYDGRSAAVQPVELLIDSAGLVHFDADGQDVSLSLSEIAIDSRIGGLPAVLRLPDGGRIEVADHDALDACLDAAGIRINLLHRIERHKLLAGGSVVFLLVFAALVYFQGLPLAGRLLAPMVPQQWVEVLGEGVLEQLDQAIFFPSDLDAERRFELRQLFDRLQAGIDVRGELTLEFRNGGLIDANAFALPDGTIVLTDQLVQVAANDDQIAGVLLHEIGHVVNRHAMRQVIQRSGLGALSLIIFGDVSGLGALLIALPAVVLETAFSRDMEREADDFAAERLEALDIPLAAFTEFFSRMDLYVRQCRRTLETETAQAEDDDRSIAQIVFSGDHLPPAPPIDVEAVRNCLAADRSADAVAPREKPESRWFNYLSTHPATEERVERLGQQ